MKNKCYFFVMTAVLLLSSALSVAQNKVKINRQSEIILPKGLDYEQKVYPSYTFYTPVPSFNNNDIDGVNVTLKCISKIGVTPSQASIYNKEFRTNVYFNGKNEEKVKVPEGLYDICVSFYGGTSFYVFKENVKLGEGTVVEVNQNESINAVQFSFTDENSNPLFMDVYDGSKLVEEGTAQGMTKLTAFNHKEYGNVGLILSMGYMPLKYPMEFYVNNLSDNYVIGNGANIMANGITYTYKTSLTSVNESVTRNMGGSDLMECVTTINVADIMDGDKNAYVPGYNFTLLYKGKSCVGERAFLPNELSEGNEIISMIYCPESDSSTADEVNVIYSPILSNYYTITEDDWGKYTYYYGIAGCAMMGDKNGIKYVNGGVDSDWYGFNTPENSLDNQFYPGHPEFSFENKEGKMTFGNCCPVTSIRSTRYMDNGYIDGWDSPIFTGRHGELFETEAYLLGINEEILDDGRTKGTVVNDMVMVDGTPGKNITEYVFNLQQEDFTAPTLQMLSFKNSEGVITDRIADVKNSKLIFTGGDFNYIFDTKEWTGFFTIGKADVEVSYSKRGEEDWHELVVNEIPEKRFMPYFGNFYEASLEEVINENENQWFDLMITFKDAAGNYQKQLISPAFMIENKIGSGITKITSEKTSLFYMNGMVCLSGSLNANFEICTLSGAVIRSACGSKVSVDGLPNGVYIVYAQTELGDILTKKIIVD